MIGFDVYTRFSNHFKHVLKLLIRKHRFNVVVAETRDKLHFEIYIALCSR